MGKFLFFALGVGITVFVVVKGREIAQKATPQHLQESAAKKVGSLADQVSEFIHTVQDSMAEREDELRTELGMEKS
ncbi:hypothetical protein IPV09_02260 [Tessaracoccus sp. SD287]|uniref:hypothetical protein n=1 Tax=Tessaracoccus sp. SD287 TaxID=2782008 RepID=UPI001A961496|nr:hypothetical protein [Tessaracoccus sp. SD287]MBO1030156.1 hypothetical protein [Tessaracoccus sp. SD287]